MSSTPSEAWRIVEVKGGLPHTLFHGLDPVLLHRSRRSRRLEVGLWMEAEEKLVVDGGGQEGYLSGFNVLLSREKAVEYLSRFTAPRDLRIARCEVRDLRPKPTNPDVMLAKWLRIVEVE